MAQKIGSINIEDFAWTFPLYALIAAGKMGICFAAPDNQLALFTDSDAAERFRDQYQEGFILLPLPKEIAVGFLKSLSDTFHGTMIDHNTDWGFYCKLETVLRLLSRTDHLE
jgi:hypothetical protein